MPGRTDRSAAAPTAPAYIRPGGARPGARRRASCDAAFDLGLQKRDPRARLRRDRDRVRYRRRIGDEIALVQCQNDGLLAEPELMQNRLYTAALAFPIEARGVEHVDEEIGVLERRAESIDQLGRQRVDESHRVDDANRAITG